MKGKILLDEVIEKNGLKELVDKFYAKAGVTITKEMLIQKNAYGRYHISYSDAWGATF